MMSHPNPRRRPAKHRRDPRVKYLIASGSMLALLGVLVDLRGLIKGDVPPDVCQQIIQPQSVLSRDELSRLLQLPERDSKAAVREIVSEPYCQLSTVEIEAGVLAEREAYPLAFDPQTWLVIFYEGEEYVGYSFSFQL